MKKTMLLLVLAGLFLLLWGAASALTLDVSYATPVTCREPTVFTLSADGSDQTLYALNCVYRYYAEDNEWVLVVDPSLGGYKMSYTTDSQFTFPFRTSGQYRLKFYAMDKGVSPIQTASKWVTFTINDADAPTAEALADDVVQKCLNAGCATQFDKALWLHDWLIDNSDYDYTYSFCSADAALTGNKGTCESYHRAYCMLLTRAGIPCGRVTGNGHVWTVLCIDGEWGQVDVTWDDSAAQESFYRHLYFFITDDMMRVAHDEHAADASRPCNSLTYNYFLQTGEVSQWTEDLLAQMNPAAGNVGTATPEQSLAPSVEPIVREIVLEALRGYAGPAVKTYHAEYAEGTYLCCFTSDNHVPEGLERIEAEAFAGSDIQSMVLPQGATAIGARAFAGCASLGWIEIPDSVTDIAADAFSGTNVRILCKEGSTAHTFATTNSIPCSLL